MVAKKEKNLSFRVITSSPALLLKEKGASPLVCSPYKKAAGVKEMVFLKINTGVSGKIFFSIEY
jgi:hypothetical protein